MTLIPITLYTGSLGTTLLAGLAAAALAYYINKRALKAWGDTAVIYGAPLIEEGIKTCIAIVLGADIALTHITFGSVEAVYDFLGHKGERGQRAALVGLVSHGIFGVVTAVVSRYFHSILVGIAAAVLLHMVWNYAVMTLK